MSRWAAATCPNTIERYVWDGEQLLYELRAPGGSTANLQTAWGSGKQYGRVDYLHGAGLDAPLGIMRMSHSEGTFLLVGYTNWRGQYARGTLHQSSWPECNGSNGPSCILIDWPAPKLRVYLDGHERPKGDWLGSLLQDQRDQSGLLYRRNRYYDPATGQFTQQDPIGLAGGMNLYGFAAGDPVNFADPLGSAQTPSKCSNMRSQWISNTPPSESLQIIKSAGGMTLDSEPDRMVAYL